MADDAEEKENDVDDAINANAADEDNDLLC
jgi:hypothetical protein